VATPRGARFAHPGNGGAGSGVVGYRDHRRRFTHASRWVQVVIDSYFPTLFLDRQLIVHVVAAADSGATRITGRHVHDVAERFVSYATVDQPVGAVIAVPFHGPTGCGAFPFGIRRARRKTRTVRFFVIAVDPRGTAFSCRYFLHFSKTSVRIVFL